MSFRVNLFDVSNATTWETRDDTEVWFSFFEGEANSPFYNVADDGWVEYRIPLVGGTTMGPYNNGFVLTYASWTVGIPGNGVLDLDQIENRIGNSKKKFYSIAYFIFFDGENY